MAAAGATRVLVAHADHALRSAIAAALKPNGFTVLPLSDSEVSWKVLEASRGPCMVVVSVVLPSEGGIALCEKIRAKLGRTAWIILEMTGATAAQVEAGVRAGADDFAVGPTDAVDRVLAGEKSFERERELQTLTERLEARLAAGDLTQT